MYFERAQKKKSIFSSTELASPEQILLKLAHCKLLLRDTQSATQLLISASNLMHKNTNVLNKLAIALLLNDQLKEAEDIISKSIILDRVSISLFIRGVIFHKLGNDYLAL